MINDWILSTDPRSSLFKPLHSQGADMDHLTATAVLSRSAGVAWVDSDDRIVILRVAKLDPLPLVLTDSAATIWRTLSPPMTPPELAVAVAKAYGVTPEDVREGVELFLHDSIGNGLIEIDAGLTPPGVALG